jgi:uncharacterized membrane protein YkvI
MVPIMILGMAFLCIFASVCGLPVFSAFDNLKSNPLVSSLCYVSYNTITAGSVLVPMAKSATSRSLRGAAVLSGGVLGLLIFAVWFVLNIYYDIIFTAEMPLLELAAFHGNSFKIIYSLILFMALCTTAISHGFGLLSKFKFKSTTDRIIAAALFCLLAMPFARFGFSLLISKLYAVFGFLGLYWAGLVVYNYCRRNGKLPF